MGFSFWTFLMERDMYGQAVGVHYRGSDVFQTKLGALVTIASYALILTNFVTLLQAFFDGSRQQESASELVYDRYSAGQFELIQNKVAITLFEKGSPLDPRYGRYKASLSNKLDLPIAPCSP